MEAKPQSYIIIDHGANLIKAGLSSDDQPSVVMPSISGTKRVTMGNRMMSKGNSSDLPCLYGEEAISKSGILRMDATIDNRTNLKESAKGLYLNVFKKLNVWDGDNNCLKDTTDYKLVFLVSPFVNKLFIENILTIFFNIFKFKEIFLIPNPVAVVNNKNSNFGCVFDLGETVLDLVVVKNNKIVKEKSKQLNVGGKNVTEYLKTFFEDGEYFKFDSMRELNLFKEQNLKICPEAGDIIENCDKVKCTVEDSTFEFEKELYHAADLIFKDQFGLINALKDIYNECSELILNTYLAGLGTKIKNFDVRLKHEISKIFNNNEFTIYNNFENGDYSAWMGAKKIIDNDFFESFKIESTNEINGKLCESITTDFIFKQ